MKQISIYLAGPADDITLQQATDWRIALADEYPAVLFYNPIGPWLNARQENAMIVDHGNRHMIHTCYGLLANLSGPGYAFGTVREIEFARSAGRPVAICTDGRLGNHNLMTHDCKVFDTLHASVNSLLETIGEGLRQSPRGGLVGALQLLPPQIEDEDDDDAS